VFSRCTIAITATELELLACFAVEPTLSEPDKPWWYVDATYRVELEELLVTFKVHPSYKDVELLVVRNDRPVYDLTAIGVEDVRVSNIPGCDTFEIWITTKQLLRIQLRPRLGIVHRFEDLPPWTGVADLQT
jgi:hypothetical protein